MLAFCLGEALIFIYFAWLADQMQNIIVTGMHVTSVFIPTAIAALLFPYMKRVRGVWDSSPCKMWKFLGLPVVVWGAAVNLFYAVFLLYYFIFNQAAKQFIGPSVVVFVLTWVSGIAWYYIWRARSKSLGVDVSLTYGELPPE